MSPVMKGGTCAHVNTPAGSKPITTTTLGPPDLWLPPPSPPIPPSPPPPPPPPPPELVRIVRIYDYCNTYSPYVAQGAEYYRSFLEPQGVDVQYIRMTPIDGDICWNETTTPEIGIKFCEDLGPGTAGSTGMNWIQTDTQRWELQSWIVFNEDDANVIFGCGAPGCVPTHQNYAGLFLANHELGHSCGNLPHRDTLDIPWSCMSSNGSRAPEWLLQSEINQIISLLPSGEMSMMSMATPEFVSCDLQPPTEDPV